MAVDTPRRSSAAALPVVLLAGLAGVFAWLVVRARSEGGGGRSLSAERPTTPIGRVGEPGPQWTVVETVGVARPAGEVATHLHDHGGLPGLTGGLEGPVMDRVEWDVEGSGHFEAEVHGLPGFNHTEITVRVSPTHGGVGGAGQKAVAAVPHLGGGSVRAQVSRSLRDLQRLLETTQPGSAARAGSPAVESGREH